MGEDLFKVYEGQKYGCEKCKDTGRIISKAKVIKCPDCADMPPGVILDDKIIEERQQNIVPEKFRGMMFDKSKILSDPRVSPEMRRSQEFNYYLETITSIYNAINTKTEMKYSILLTAPQGMGKTSLVYSCLNAAIRTGQTASPYLDSLELNDLLLKNDSDTIERIVNADICFLKVANTNLVGAMRALMIFIDRRARRGLPTIVTSRFTVNYLYTIDYNLINLFITNNFGDSPFDYSRLRVVSSVYPDYKELKKKIEKGTK